MDAFDRFLELCRARGWSLYEFGMNSDISLATIYKWKNGKSNISRNSIEKVCDVFDITEDQFWNGFGKTDITGEQQDFLSKFSLLPKEDQTYIIQSIDFLIKKNQRKNRRD